eukprot:4759375-Amphidinium_carterae.1
MQAMRDQRDERRRQHGMVRVPVNKLQKAGHAGPSRALQSQPQQRTVAKPFSSTFSQWIRAAQHRHIPGSMGRVFFFCL